MAKFDNALQVFRLLDKSNCRMCGEKTCLAFAGAVFTGRRKLQECPTVSREHLAKYGSAAERAAPPAQDPADDLFEAFSRELAGLDLQQAASRTGGVYNAPLLTVKVLGKDFSVDNHANFYTDIHINHWVTAPFLNYVIKSRGVAPTGEWVPMRELAGGAERYPLFRKRAEEAMQRIADVYPELFDDLVHLFSGKQITSPYDSDISVVLPVFPLVPFLICYWKPDEGMESSLKVFFDRSLDWNLDSETAFTLGAGLAQMFEKLALRHGYVPK
ncbi:MAG: DUF3786 domain-containing protein [Desulfofustis sp.]|jgi:hypothetical protein|nr:DUF3786 domain-containing protein [Desulfofustis sp.]